MRPANYPPIVLGLIVLLCATLAAHSAQAQTSAATEWPSYGNDPGGMRYSPLTEINRENVSKLKVAWVFHTGDVQNSPDGSKRSGFETTPILVDGMLYITTAFNRVIALDPATGRQKWSYDPKIEHTPDYGDGLVNRGATAWVDASRSAGQACRTRIFEATQDARLIAIDAANGKPCADFGKGGEISLRDVSGY